MGRAAALFVRGQYVADALFGVGVTVQRQQVGRVTQAARQRVVVGFTEPPGEQAERAQELRLCLYRVPGTAQRYAQEHLRIQRRQRTGAERVLAGLPDLLDARNGLRVLAGLKQVTGDIAGRATSTDARAQGPR